MKILYSYECPELLPQIAEYLLEEWEQTYKYEHKGLQEIIDELNECKSSDKIPITLVAIDNGKFVGTASIIEYDMIIRKDLTPWLASLFIAPEYRNSEIVMNILNQIGLELKRLGITEAYLYTYHHDKYYKRLGFELVEKIKYGSKQVAIMKMTDVDKFLNGISKRKIIIKE